MARELSIFCNHNIKANSLEKLAIGLSERLQANILYGHDLKIIISEINKTIDYEYDINKIGEIHYDINAPKYAILDERIKYEYLKDILAPKLQSNSYAIDSYLKTLCEPSNDYEMELHFYDEASNKWNFIAYLSYSVIEVWEIPWYINWRDYQEYFLCTINDFDWESLQKWRKEILKFVKKMGGNFVIGYCFEDDSAAAFDAFQNNSIEEGIEVLSQEFEGRIVNITKYFSAKDFLNTPSFIRYPSSYIAMRISNYEKLNNVKVYTPDIEYPVIFYDDFSDLDASIKGSFNFWDFIYDGSGIIKQIDEKCRIFKEFKVKREYLNLPELIDYTFYKRIIISLRPSQCSTQDELSLKINQEVFLLREPKNFITKNAISLHIYKEEQPKFNKITRIAYVPIKYTETIAQEIDQGTRMRAFITEIREENIDNYNNTDVLVVSLYKHN